MEQTNRRPSWRIPKPPQSNKCKNPGGAGILASGIWRGFGHFHDHKSGTFKKHRRIELKVSARRKQRG
jgi:hypothetical protein